MSPDATNRAAFVDEEARRAGGGVMSKALDGGHYCASHQGNHSHYAEENCAVCKLEAERDRLREAHEANIKQVRKYRRGTEGHRCEWRVIAEAIESRSVAALEVE
jgi:hypothetical protein